MISSTSVYKLNFGNYSVLWFEHKHPSSEWQNQQHAILKSIQICIKTIVTTFNSIREICSLDMTLHVA